MTYEQIIKAAIPEADAALIDYVLWEKHLRSR